MVPTIFNISISVAIYHPADEYAGSLPSVPSVKELLKAMDIPSFVNLDAIDFFVSFFHLASMIV